MPLSPTAAAAVAASQQWGTQTNTPAAGADGRVLYSYGAGMPTVVCAPLRVCIVEMEPGEKIVGEPHIGDAVRWNVAPAIYGEGPQATALIVLKPQAPGLDTNMLITTDRRAYYLRLISKPSRLHRADRFRLSRRRSASLAAPSGGAAGYGGADACGSIARHDRH